MRVQWFVTDYFTVDGEEPAATHSCDASALIWDVFWWLRGPLRATTRVRGHPRVGESRKWPSHALCGAFLAGFRVEDTAERLARAGGPF